MPQKTRLDVGSPNFDLYFAHEFKQKITPQGKEGLPKDISFKIFRKGDEFNPKNTSKLNFVERLFVLWKALKKRWWLIVEDHEKGLGMDEFCRAWQEQRKRDYGSRNADDFSQSGNFLLASKEVADMFDYLNHLSNGPAYNYVIKSKNNFPPIPNKAADNRKRMMALVEFFMEYDKNKKTWCSEYNVSIPEWYVLLALYHGNEVKGSPIHKEIFRRAYQSSPTKIKRCFGVLQAKGYIHKTGERSGAKLRITPLGTELVNNIINKYVLSF